MMESPVKTRRKILFERFAANATLHGFRYLVQDNRKRKCLWLIIILACFSFAGVLFYSILYDFLTYKTTTITTVVYDKTEIEFPTITVCPINCPMSQ